MNKKPLFKTVILLAILFYVNVGFSQTTYTVTSTLKSGPGSFLEAVELANNNPGADIIEFTPDLQVDASFPGAVNPGDYMAYVTESVVIDGKGGALNGYQKWVSSDGSINELGVCPLSIGSSIILHKMPNFIEIGIPGQDNSAIQVTIKNLSIKQFNSIASVRKNATLSTENFKADEIWSTLTCGTTSILSAYAGSSVSMKNAEITNCENWGGTAISSDVNASDLTVEECFFYNINNREQFLIGWNGETGSVVNVVSSRFISSGGFDISGNVDSTNIVNSSWVNSDVSSPSYGDRIINNSTGDMNIVSSTIMWNSNFCNTICQNTASSNLIESQAGDINFIESAIAINFPSNGINLLQTLGGSGTFTADAYTWIQPTANQDVNALQVITSQPFLLTNLPAFNTPITSFNPLFDAEMITPNVSGQLIDYISTPLINPISGSPILFDVFGNDRMDANGQRDIGAFQLALAPVLSISGIYDSAIELSWNEPLHHNNLTILRYELSYVEPAIFPIVVPVNIPNLTKTILGLTNGLEYEFSVRAVYDNNGVEVNGPYGNVLVGTPYGQLYSPNLTATPGDEEVTVNWSLPNLGGREFESYILLWRIDGTSNYTGAEAILDLNQISTTITGLANGTNYQFAIKVKASGEYSNYDYATATPNSSVGIDELTEKHISFYPNPVNSILNIKVDQDFNVKLFSTEGKLLIESSNVKTIDVSSLSRGVYVLQIKTESKTYSGKIIRD